MSEWYIFGAGIQGRIFASVLAESPLKIMGFLDSFCEEARVLDLPVIRPEDAEKAKGVLVSVGMKSQQIKSELLKCGFDTVLDFNESMVRFPELIHGMKSHSLWYADRSEEMAWQEGINRFVSLLVDDTSKSLLSKIVRFRRGFDAKDYIFPDKETQYFPSDVPVFDNISALRFVDAGAYTGDTITSLLRVMETNSVSMEFAACFEPDSKNLTKLKACLVDNKSYQGNIFLYPSAVWDNTGLLSFSAHANSSSTVSRDSKNTELVSCVALDDVLCAVAPNFIKMDVEGAEQNAIRGAGKLICEHRPVLAICLYHRPADLWEIPLLIHEICPHYDMYLRVYGDLCLETVLYCIPQK